MYRLLLFFILLTSLLAFNSRNIKKNAELNLVQEKRKWRAKNVNLVYPLEGSSLIKYTRDENIFLGNSYLVDVSVEGLNEEEEKAFLNFIVEKEFLEKLNQKK